MCVFNVPYALMCCGPMMNVYVAMNSEHTSNLCLLLLCHIQHQQKKTGAECRKREPIENTYRLLHVCVCVTVNARVSSHFNSWNFFRDIYNMRWLPLPVLFLIENFWPKFDLHPLFSFLLVVFCSLHLVEHKKETSIEKKDEIAFIIMLSKQISK